MKLTVILLLSIFFISFFSIAKDIDKSLTDVNLQLKWRHQFQFAGYYAAIKKGYYRDIGLNVHLMERKPGLTPIDNLIVGQTDYAIGGVGSLIYRLNGVPLVALAATFQRTPSVLISRFPDVISLKNKKIMLSKGLMNAEISSLLKQHGLSQHDYELVPSNQSIEGFIQGEYDAYNGYIANEVYQLNQKNIPHYIISPLDDDSAFYGDILLTTERKLKTSPTEVMQFRAASIKGWEYAVTHIDEIIDLIIKDYNTQNKSREQLTVEANELIRLMHVNIVPVGYMHEKRWLAIANTLQKHGYLSDGKVNIDGFIFPHLRNNGLYIFTEDNVKSILISVTLIIGPFLLIYNRRLKMKVRERTFELNLAREQAENDARTDPLTGIANRRAFMEVFAHDLAIARRNDFALSFISIDIDWFKQVNDTYGHLAGDVALTLVGKILTDSARASDTPARIGGEEFGVVCLEKNQKDAINLAERLRREVEKSTIKYQDVEFKITLSLGVTSVGPKDNLELVLKRSDAALYKAKKLGRNQVQWL